MDLTLTFGWPTPIFGDSGNGGHLLYDVDLPAADEGLIQQCIEAIAQRYSDAEDVAARQD